MRRGSSSAVLDSVVGLCQTRLRAVRVGLSAEQLAFIGVLALYAALALWTLDLYPTVWFDEVEIVSAARSAFPGPPSPATVELSDGSRPTTFTWAHALVMQPFFQAFGLSPTAARLSSLIGGLLAVVLLRSVLSQLGTRPFFAAIVALFLLTDGVFRLSVSGARAEGWAFAWAFASILVAARACAGKRSPALMACAGVCTAASLLTWPTAALLVPLVVIPLTRTPGARSPQVLVRNLLILGLACGMTLALATLASFWPQPVERLIATQRALSVAYSGLGGDNPGFFAELVRLYLPQVWMLTLFAYALLLAVRLPSWPILGAIWALGVALLAVALSFPYIWRYLYVLPSALVVLALGSEALVQSLEKRRRVGLVNLYLATLIACLASNFVSPPVIGPAFSWEQRAARDYARVESALNGKVLAGERVFGIHSAFYAVQNAGGRLISRFHIMHSDGTLSGPYQAYRVREGDSVRQILSDEPEVIDFLRTIDVIVAPYQTASASELVSADRTVRFEKVGELPDYLDSPRSEGLEGFWDVPYSFAVFRRLK